jgi:hypothetical protein
VAYGTSQNPTTANNTTINGSGVGVFTSTLTGLTASTLYNIRAYATNSVGTAYGNQTSFTTSAALPTLTTTSVSQITSSGATTGGNVTSDGGSTVTARGVAYGTSQNPTTANNTTSNGSGVGVFTSTLTGLTASTLYNIRAYATNSVGTAYGNQTSFTTSVILYLPNIGTNTATSVTRTTAIIGGNLTWDGNSLVTGRGVCWDLTSNVDMTSSQANVPWGSSPIGTLGSFSYTLQGFTQLSPNTTYYFRAYATNSVGTALGPVRSFTTLP